MERELHLSEEEKDKILAHTNLVLQLKGNAGFQVLMEHLKVDAHEAMHKLKDVDPYKPDLIQKCQNEIWRYEGLLDKIEYIINIGEAIKLDKLENEGE